MTSEEEVAWEAYLALLLTPEEREVYDAIPEEPINASELVSRLYDDSNLNDYSAIEMLRQLVHKDLVVREHLEGSRWWFYSRKTRRPPCEAASEVV